MENFDAFDIALVLTQNVGISFALIIHCTVLAIPSESQLASIRETCRIMTVVLVQLQRAALPSRRDRNLPRRSLR